MLFLDSNLHFHLVERLNQFRICTIPFPIRPTAASWKNSENQGRIDKTVYSTFQHTQYYYSRVKKFRWGFMQKFHVNFDWKFGNTTCDFISSLWGISCIIYSKMFYVSKFGIFWNTCWNFLQFIINL